VDVWPEIDGSRQPTEIELAIALQGRYVAQIANGLIAGRKTVG
jgi:hypothetical protein